ncbi:fibronectin type III domain-containing protein [Rutstroemia sp. NJR-2017a WRK4]|nr:fibronectin type III domain-containing protein [Rutstroemia sp. NJR-2017a WRK4]
MNAVNFYAGLIDWVFSHVKDLDEYMFIIQSIVTCVEVPEPPEVSLACIKSDSLTLHWTPSTLNRAVVRYLIQVNGVNVGESTQGETIIIEGLKPGHFYNVRVIAVGTNNFQAGSRVIRLRTLGRDGLPQHGTAQSATDTAKDDQQEGTEGEELPTVRAHGVANDTPNLPATTAQVIVRDTGSSHPGQRRNTGNAGGRKRSPSTVGPDSLPSLLVLSSDDSPESIQELQRKQDAAQKEVEDVTSQGQKESEDMRSQISLLSKEKEEKTQIYKEKEEASEKLRKEVNTLERQNRDSQTRKSRKEKALQSKQAERKKMQDDQKRWKKELSEMEAERESWRREKEEIGANVETKREELRESIRAAREKLDQLGKDIERKGLQIKKLEEERQNQAGAFNEEERHLWDTDERNQDIAWEQANNATYGRITNLQVRHAQLQREYENAQTQYAQLYSRQTTNPLMYHGNSSGVDFDPNNTQGKAKSRRQRNRKSRGNTVSSPPTAFQNLDSQFTSTGVFGNFHTSSPGYVAPPPYMDLAMSNDMDLIPLQGHFGGMTEADIQALTAGAPLSPTATSLLPSSLFNDDDLPSPGEGDFAYVPDLPRAFSPVNQRNDTQSPGSSRSASLLSSPHASSHNLAKYGVKSHDYGLDNEQRSLDSPGTKYGVIGSPARKDQTPSHRNFGSMFTSLIKSDKSSQEGLALGSLKPGQSHSFPRSTDEPEASTNRHRRISFSSGWPGFLNRSATVGESSEGNGPAPARSSGMRRPLGFNMFGSRNEDPLVLRSARDPSSPRPVSIASSDLPRPSTDSAPFGWGVAIDGNINRNSPLAANWAIDATPTWSGNPSRRPSAHAVATGMTSGIASEDDEKLPRETLRIQSSPPPAIGTRPLSSHNPFAPKLNPTAPKFELPQTSEPVLSRLLRASKGKGKAPATDFNSERPSTAEDVQQAIQSSPSESRKSRDTPSLHTQNSMAESVDSLERIPSNANSDVPKDKESSIQRLFRKGSSSKFSFQGKDSGSGLFSRKKGGSSVAASDRADRDENLDEFDEEAGPSASFDSAANSPRIGGTDAGEGKGKASAGGSFKDSKLAWGRAFGRKKEKEKGRESLDVERSEAETTGTEDEG